MSNNYLFDNINQNELNSLYLDHKEQYQELRKKLKLSNESARLNFLSNLVAELLQNRLASAKHEKSMTTYDETVVIYNTEDEKIKISTVYKHENLTPNLPYEEYKRSCSKFKGLDTASFLLKYI